ncbi:efflux RND transporter periplasmic adaptor subunit [Vibrio sp. TH_r3]|uniref:efflux RND transporter periplasmic adaptor subunit n=1 Tax=Vibrio sp. TH_r3 TaxID=3082084 RepID=UPI0029555C0C|nr:efflux RND transporter periplasmic adaptor subunit [Vibrio sp. TH_r3]MDV7104589.1 efflux RND transporter periplasmic adaptor subunit [Vibrio sp. TH_r3]
MRQFLIFLASAGILCTAYLFSFGVPNALKNVVGLDSAQTEEQKSNSAERSERGAQETIVVMQPLAERHYNLFLTTIGTATSLRSIKVVSSVAGKITDVSIDGNNVVEAGDVLVQLDSRSEQLALNVAVTELEQVQGLYDRYKVLGSNGNTTITDLTFVETEAALKLAQYNVDLAQNALDERTIRAEIGGTLGLSDAQVGAYINVGDTIVTINDSSAIVAEFEIPERSIAFLEVGKPVQISTPTYDGRFFDGTIIAFDSELDPASRSATVRAQIDNPDGALIAGMTFSVRIVEQTEPLPVVPATAVTWSREGANIWTVEDGVAAPHSAAIRYRSGTRVWLETDLPLGATVITEGAAKLRAGTVVTDAEGAAR